MKVLIVGLDESVQGQKLLLEGNCSLLGHEPALLPPPPLPLLQVLRYLEDQLNVLVDQLLFFSLKLIAA